MSILDLSAVFNGSFSSIWIWGSKTAFSHFLVSYLENIGLGNRFAGFVDNDPEQQNKYILGYKIFSPKNFTSCYSEEDVVFISCTKEENYVSIKKQLAENDISQNIIYVNPTHFDGMYYKSGNHIEIGDETDETISKCCNYIDFQQDYFKLLMNKLDRHPNRFHRKDWEFVFISRVLDLNNMLIPGKTGLGFAVGTEPLPSYFASRGVKCLATDLWEKDIFGNINSDWGKTGQNAEGNINLLYHKNIISRELFDKNIVYRNLDMNRIPSDIGKFDFCWSSCAIEHVGNLELSKQFLKNMIQVLKPGGIAVHTTEFNLSSNEDTLTEGCSVIYRRKDLEELKNWFENNGCEMRLSFKRGCRKEDMYLPFPPYPIEDKRDHLSLLVDKFVCTSYGIVIKKLY